MRKILLLASFFATFAAFGAVVPASLDVGPHAFSKHFGAMRLPDHLGGSMPTSACKVCIGVH
ncbi:hypothetical protein FJY93_04630 [Candidatus Kaiserbacteria bacterium]|nr:hypothetical protein [Candidatus Kaiserbacteria bacterium]